MTIKDRMVSPTPKFFRTIRNVSLLLAGISSVILTAPVSLPPVMVSVAGYLAVAGGIAGVISQSTTKNVEE